jgi:hypothetical protein
VHARNRIGCGSIVALTSSSLYGISTLFQATVYFLIMRVDLLNRVQQC